MGQKLFEDKITNLSESGGTITLAAGARLTIGGQQFTTSSALNVVANLSSVNTRYQIYAVLNSGVVELIVSANENSVGPAGYMAWKLVGSYYTNGKSPVTFGTFVNVKDVPHTKGSFLSSFDIITDTTLTPLPQPSELQEVRVKRFGKMAILEFSAYGGWASESTGSLYLFLTPSNIQIDLLNVRSGTSSVLHRSMSVGEGSYINNSVNGISMNLITYVWNADALMAAGTNTVNLNLRNLAPSTVNLTTGFSDIKINATVPIQGWDNTPIEDL